MPTFERNYPSVAESEEKMLDDVLVFLRENDIPGNLINPFVLAVSEAFNNAMVHGNEADPERTVTLSLLINDKVVSADISDQGRGGLEKIRRRPPPTVLSESGRGVDLMTHYASELTFRESPAGGLTVSLTFELKKEKNKV
ncbi:MAG: ATP-binding protein [Candidatus Zixiibacteriota bacterium]